MNAARELVLDVALRLGCTLGLSEAARATLIAGGLVCAGAERLRVGPWPGRAGRWGTR
jgi:hypothetical protein